MISPDSDSFRTERHFMVQSHLRARGITDAMVLEAFERVPRELFVGDHDLRESYADHPLSIGEGQTISQPYIVALMAQALELTGKERILEIGTGSGYQTAILSLISGHIFTVERLGPLYDEAKARLENMGLNNVSFRLGDGSLGWREEAPFERIVVSAAAPDIPEPLCAQLVDGGKMVIPVGGAMGQELLLVTRKKSHIKREHLCGCVFVKLIGEQGWN